MTSASDVAFYLNICGADWERSREGSTQSAYLWGFLKLCSSIPDHWFSMVIPFITTNLIYGVPKIIGFAITITKPKLFIGFAIDK